jgi:hypothetical protein
LIGVVVPVFILHSLFEGFAGFPNRDYYQNHYSTDPRLIHRLLDFENVFPGFGLIQANSIYIITSGTKAVAFEVPFQPTVFLEYDHCTFTLQAANLA